MAEKKIKTRIQQKVDTKANWDKATNFIPLKGEYIYYSDTHEVKVGDGVTKLSVLQPIKGAANASDKNQTLAWGTKSTVATVDGVDLHVTMPGNPNTDTKVTSAANHYTPAADSSAQLSVDASSTVAATWNSTSLVTGVNLQRDAKGHVTGVTVDSIKMPANPNTDTNTHYTTGAYVGATNVKANAATTNGNTYLKVYDDNTRRAEFLIKGSGATSVSSDANGNITISSTDTNTHQSVTDRNPTLAWSTKSTVANIGGTDIHVTMPANPNTDTHFTTGLYVGKADEKSNSATTNGNTYLKLYDNDTKRAQYLINGGGATTITSNTSGSITVSTPIRNLDTTSSSGLSAGSENIAGSGTVYLHKVAKTGSYNDLLNKPTIPNISNLVPYTGATKDVVLGKHSLSISNKDDTGNPTIKVSSKGLSEDDVYCEISSTGVNLMDPGAGTGYCVNYIDINGFKVYLPNAPYMPSGAEVFAMKSNLSNLLDKGTSSTVVNQVLYNPVEMKKALTVPSIQTTPIQFGPDATTDIESAVTIGSTTTSLGNTAAQIRLASPGLGSATITVDSGAFSIACGTTLACSGEVSSPWTVDGSPIITAKNMTNYLSVQEWKLTSTTGTVTTVNICTK